MRKFAFYLALPALLLGFVSAAYGQAKKPTLMVVPSDAYCIEKGFFSTVQDQGQSFKVPDYRRAFQEDPDLRAIISGVNNFMTDQGFPLKDMEAEMKAIDNRNIEEEELSDKSGAALKESRLDRIKRNSKADIILDLYFAIKRNGPEKTMTFNLKGLDAYTSKQVAGVEGAGKPSLTTDIQTLMREDNYVRMTEFTNRLQGHFDEMFKIGREVSVIIRLAEDAPVEFDTEYGDLEFSEVIDGWFKDNTVEGRYTVTDMSDVRMAITARIPLYSKDPRNGTEKAIDTREFAQMLRKFLKAAPYNLSCRVSPRGLGEVYLIIGNPQ